MLVGPVVKRLGDRTTMVIGLAFGAIGLSAMGLAPTGWLFVAAMFPNALWGLAMPTIQSLMTQRVSGEVETPSTLPFAIPFAVPDSPKQEL